MNCLRSFGSVLQSSTPQYILDRAAIGWYAYTTFKVLQNIQPAFCFTPRIDRSNLFEDICALVSKTAFPVTPKSLGPLHATSLETIVTVLQQLADNISAQVRVGGRAGGQIAGS